MGDERRVDAASCEQIRIALRMQRDLGFEAALIRMRVYGVDEELARTLLSGRRDRRMHADRRGSVRGCGKPEVGESVAEAGGTRRA